ncbi:MAG: hypothetical protein HW416_955 [Chloroflexi bacterium]|nr:hypothetical protein [Chloroflexota bacterium]
MKEGGSKEMAQKTTSSVSAFVEEVTGIFSQYWGGHYEVVQTFFSRKPAQEDLVNWLEWQAHKEIQSIPRQAKSILEMYENLDEEVERGEMRHEAYEMADEILHYCVLTDILEMITGRRRPAREFVGSTSRESVALREVRRQGGRGRLADLVGSFGGPGGGTAFSAAGMLIDGGPVERQLAAAFKIIHDQELHHYQSARFAFDQNVGQADSSELPGALEFARNLARAHFLERNALFSYPLSPERIAEIDAGLVARFDPH